MPSTATAAVAGDGWGGTLLRNSYIAAGSLKSLRSARRLFLRVASPQVHTFSENEASIPGAGLYRYFIFAQDRSRLVAETASSTTPWRHVMVQQANTGGARSQRVASSRRYCACQ